MLYNILIYSCGWFLLNNIYRISSPNQNVRYYSNLVSLVHAITCVIVSIIMLLFNNYSEINNLYTLSMSYFIYDLSNCYNDRVFLLHHIASLIIIYSTLMTENVNYYYYTNLILIFTELTGILQNYFFAQKLWYGNERKLEFIKNHINIFKLYSNLFIVCRMIIIPVLLYKFCDIIEEYYYRFIIVIVSCCIICGSLFWIKGQIKMYKSMLQTLKNE